MNREEVLQTIAPIADLKPFHFQRSPRTRVIVEPERVGVRVSDRKTLLFTREGKLKLFQFMGMPATFENKLQPSTLGMVASELLNREDQCTFLVKDDEVEDVVKDVHYQLLEPERVVRTIEKTVPGVDFNRVLLLPSRTARLEVVGVAEKPVVRGDLVKAGAVVSFSPVGTSLPTVQSFVLRLSCTNGATSNTVLRNYEFGGGSGEGDNIWQWFRQSIREAYRSLAKIVGEYQQLAHREISDHDRPAILEALIRQAGLHGEEITAIQARALEQPPRNEYEMMNLITWASSHVVQEPVRIARVQRETAEWVAAAEHRQLCPVCHRAR